MQQLTSSSTPSQPPATTRQQFQIRHYMGVSAFLIEIGFNKLGVFYRLDKSEEVCMLEKRLGDVD